jgi:hypothetical protein
MQNLLTGLIPDALISLHLRGDGAGRRPMARMHFPPLFLSRQRFSMFTQLNSRGSS